jgi:hypothetical protein
MSALFSARSTRFSRSFPEGCQALPLTSRRKRCVVIGGRKRPGGELVVNRLYALMIASSCAPLDSRLGVA